MGACAGLVGATGTSVGSMGAGGVGSPDGTSDVGAAMGAGVDATGADVDATGADVRTTGADVGGATGDGVGTTGAGVDSSPTGATVGSPEGITDVGAAVPRSTTRAASQEVTVRTVRDAFPVTQASMEPSGASEE